MSAGEEEPPPPPPPTSGSAPRLPRVAVLGGGVGAMTAAFELSNGDWRERFDSITVHQLGWRLGGKGASGRGAYGRIEEHGLHLWFGFYDNAFRLMRECYQELGRPAGTPLASVEEAFEKASCIVAEEHRPEGWEPWIVEFPEDGRVPGELGAAPELPSVADYVVMWLRMLRELVGSASRQPSAAATPPLRLVHADAASAAPPGLVLRQVGAAPTDGADSPADEATLILVALAAVLDAFDDLDLVDDLGLIDGVIERLRSHLRQRFLMHDDFRRLWEVADILLAATLGVVRHGLLSSPDGFDAIDEFDFTDWLVLNGAEEASARSALVKAAVYDLTFAYRDGDRSQPEIAAGTALRGLCRMFFTYKGAIAWKMRAGMGDVVFAPLYEVLRQRGVDFRFFTRVDRLRLSPDRRRVEAIDVARQVDVLGPGSYEPLVDVGGLACWPSEPRYEQLVGGEALRGHNLESFWNRRPDAAAMTLRDGEDFDVVVLGIPVGSLAALGSELVEADPAWARMVEGVTTVRTQAFQLWLGETLEELGCTWPPATTAGYVEPFDSYADMGQVLDREAWPADAGVKAVAYFCNTMPTPPGPVDPDDTDLPSRTAARVRADALRFLTRDVAHLWPGAVRRYPTEFRWELLKGAPAGVEGPSRLDTQYWRANVDPSERYVQSLPGSTRYRLDPGGSGFDNLYLAGDWTRCGLNAGCVEGAVISGMLAAKAIQGDAVGRHIVGHGSP